MAQGEHSAFPLKLFGGLGTYAVVAGGLLAAFSAARPTEFALWASAYLVLVAGVLQVGFGVGLYYLARWPDWRVSTLAFALYNIGNAGVLIGTGLKGSYSHSQTLVGAGGIFLAVSMLLLLWAVRGARLSWRSAAFYALVVIILVSMPIGLVLAGR